MRFQLLCVANLSPACQNEFQKLLKIMAVILGTAEKSKQKSNRAHKTETYKLFH